MSKSIVVVTGCRSEYDILYALIKALHDDPDYDVSVIATGAHVSEAFGGTISEIEADGFKIAGKVHNLINSDTTIGKAKSSGLLLTGLSELLYDLDPDYVLVSADREESVITAVACTYLNIPVMHVCGGDRTYPGTSLGDVDEQIRHATTKLANLHFAMAQEHADRIIKMGEEPWRVLFSGNPALDRFSQIEVIEKQKLARYFGFDDLDKPWVLMIQHVISSEYQHGHIQIEQTLEALSSIDANCVINYPNTDMGSQAMINVIEKHRSNPNFRITKNIPRSHFVNLLRTIDLLVGNSSMAFLEGSYLRLPAINIGSRQRQRLHGGNVVFADYDADEIKVKIENILQDDSYRQKLKECRQIYGDGTAAQKVIQFLKGLNKSKDELISKDITY